MPNWRPDDEEAQPVHGNRRRLRRDVERARGKHTLRTHEVELKPAPDVTAEELLALRERLHLSRQVFARYLRTNPRTLENWEQGRASRTPRPRC